jgi:RNA polymerase-binding transcription factor DksA
LADQVGEVLDENRLHLGGQQVNGEFIDALVASETPLRILLGLAARQEKFIQSLQAALVRIENKTYGVCRVTGKLIQKERLMLVPHATMSIEAKNAQQK